MPHLSTFSRLCSMHVSGPCFHICLWLLESFPQCAGPDTLVTLSGWFTLCTIEHAWLSHSLSLIENIPPVEQIWSMETRASCFGNACTSGFNILIASNVVGDQRALCDREQCTGPPQYNDPVTNLIMPQVSRDWRCQYELFVPRCYHFNTIDEDCPAVLHANRQFENTRLPWLIQIQQYLSIHKRFDRSSATDHNRPSASCTQCSWGMGSEKSSSKQEESWVSWPAPCLDDRKKILVVLVGNFYRCYSDCWKVSLFVVLDDHDDDINFCMHRRLQCFGQPRR